MHELITAKRTLVCEIADFDACDKYLFHIEKAGKELAVDWKLKGCGDSGEIHVGKKALDGGTKLIGFSQGSVSRWQGNVAKSTDTCEEGCDCHTLPFILSRAALAALKSGEPVSLNVFGAPQSFEKKGSETRTIEVDGKKTKLACLHAASDDGDLWVVDDATWPVIVRVESDGGDNYAELSIVSSKSIADLEPSLSKDD
jgi:hypothetical protein